MCDILALQFFIYGNIYLVVNAKMATSFAPAIITVLIIIIIVMVAVAIKAYKDVKNDAQKSLLSISEWAKNSSPACFNDLTPKMCQDILTSPGPVPPMPGPVPPMPGPGPRFDTAGAVFGARMVGRFIASIGSKQPGLLDLRSSSKFQAPVLLHITEDPQPIGAVWMSLDGKTAAVIFRGTQTLADLITDLDVNQRRVRRPWIPGISSRYSRSGRSAQYKQVLLSESGAGAGAGPVAVHGGVYKNYMEVRDTIMRIIRGSPVTEIFVAGHSLGAGIAFLCAYELSLPTKVPGTTPGITPKMAPKITPKIRVFGFAPPRVGNPAFARILASRVHTTSVINLADVVPSLPWSYMPGSANSLDGDDPSTFAHVTPIALFNNIKTDIASCHLIPTYLEGIRSGVTVLADA